MHPFERLDLGRVFSGASPGADIGRAVMRGDRREFYRVEYPDGYRPKMVLRHKAGEVKKCDVVDISEKGISIAGEEVSELKPKSKIEAQITFMDGESVDVKGKVLRVNEDQVAIYLAKGIPLPRIIKEQMLLRNAPRV